MDNIFLASAEANIIRLQERLSDTKEREARARLFSPLKEASDVIRCVIIGECIANGFSDVGEGNARMTPFDGKFLVA
jgi:hypothetical protein